MSETLPRGLRNYYTQDARRTLEEINHYGATPNPQGYTESDVPGLIREVRLSEPSTGSDD
jgi:hypothetical protein